MMRDLYADNYNQLKSRDREIALAPGHEDAIAELAALVMADTSLALLCACGDTRACHRSYVAKLIQDALPMPVSSWEEQAR